MPKGMVFSFLFFQALEQHFVTSRAHKGASIGGPVSGGTAQGRGLGLIGTALQQPIRCSIAVPSMGFQSLLYASQPKSDHLCLMWSQMNSNKDTKNKSIIDYVYLLRQTNRRSFTSVCATYGGSEKQPEYIQNRIQQEGHYTTNSSADCMRPFTRHTEHRSLVPCAE